MTSLMGIAYWTVAARSFSQQAVGYGSASISAMTLLGTIGMFGLGTFLISELPRHRSRAGLIVAALLACGLGSLALGAGFAIVAPHVSKRFGDMLGTPGQAALFAAGVAVTGIALVFDLATIGVLRGGLQLARNMVFGLVKLLIMVAATLVLHDQFGVGITLSWVVGMALSFVPVVIWLRFRGTRILARPEWGVLRGLGRTVMAHNWLNIAVAAPASLLPLLVTVLVSPSANAAFYIATMMTGFLSIIPGHLSTALFAVAANDPQAIARKLRFALRLSYSIGLPAVIALCLSAHWVLGLYGAGYARTAAVPMMLLALCYVPSVTWTMYIAVCRATGRIARAAVVLTAGMALMIAVVVVGAKTGGLLGMSIALLAEAFFEALLTAPAVFRTAMGAGRHRQTTSLPPTQSRYRAGAHRALSGRRRPSQACRLTWAFARNVPEPAADGGQGEPSGRRVGGERAAQAQLSVGGDEQPGPPVCGPARGSSGRSSPASNY